MTFKQTKNSKFYALIQMVVLEVKRLLYEVIESRTTAIFFSILSAHFLENHCSYLKNVNRPYTNFSFSLIFWIDILQLFVPKIVV